MDFIKIIVFLLLVVFVIYKLFFYLDIKNNCYIRINPSLLEFSNLTVKRAIKTLKYASPDDYRNLCDYVKVINPNVSCGGFGGGCYNWRWNQKSIDISTSQRKLVYTIAVIVHETCHVIQHEESRPFNEDECNQTMDGVIKRIIEF